MKFLKLIYKLISWAIVAFTVFVVAVLVLSKMNTPLNVRLFTILSGSMEPRLKVGSLVVTKNQTDYAEGDIVTVFAERSSTQTYTHRISKVIYDPEIDKTSYILKGDANEAEDNESVTKGRVIGKVIADVPYLGRVIAFAQTGVGFVLLIVLPAVILGMLEIMSIKDEVSKMRSKKKQASKDAIDRVSKKDDTQEE